VQLPPDGRRDKQLWAYFNGLLDGCFEVTDAGLEHLKGLTNLLSLTLNGCYEVTDAGLEHLKGLCLCGKREKLF